LFRQSFNEKTEAHTRSLKIEKSTMSAQKNPTDKILLLCLYSLVFSNWIFAFLYV